MTWTDDELERIGRAEELEVASLRPSGTLRSFRTIWVVRLVDDLFVRSVNGRGSDWFRGVEIRHEGHIRAGGVEKDVTFVEVGRDLDDRLDAEYGRKYHRYAQSIIDHITSGAAKAATLKLVPLSESGTATERGAQQ